MARHSRTVADLVCVDPDNGIAPESRMYDPAKGAKFVYMDDLQALWDSGKSVVVYQHIDRSKPTPAQVERVVATLRGGLENAEPIPLVFHRGQRGYSSWCRIQITTNSSMKGCAGS